MTRLVVIALLAAALAGCGSASGSSLEDSAEATAAETSRFEMVYRASGQPVKSNFTLEAVGAFDYPKERAAIAISGDFPYFGDDFSLKEVRLVGKTTYLRWIVKGKTYWVKEEASGPSGDPVELLVPFPGTPTKPTDVLTRVLSASEENENLGAEEVRGTETAHYRARVDLRKVVEQLPAGERPDDDVETVWGDRFVPVDLWIDGESRLRRITIVQREEGEPGELETTVDLFDYGVDVDVEPPPADEVISEEEFNKLEDAALEKEVSDDELISPDEVCESAREELPKKDADEVCAEARRRR